MVALVEKLKAAIIDKNAHEALATLERIVEIVRTDAELLQAILSPPVITELHQLLVDHLNVNRRHIQVRRRLPAARSRATLFVRCMIAGVKNCEFMV